MIKTIVALSNKIFIIAYYFFSSFYLLYQIVVSLWYKKGFVGKSLPALPSIRVFDNLEVAVLYSFRLMIIYLLLCLLYFLISKLKREILFDNRLFIWPFVPIAAIVVWQSYSLFGLTFAIVLSLAYLTSSTAFLIQSIKNIGMKSND